MRLIIAFGYFISMCHGLNSQSDLAYLPGYFEDIDSSSKLKKAVDKTTVRPATVAQPALPAATVLKESKIDSERLVHWQAAQMFGLAGKKREAIIHINKTYKARYKHSDNAEDKQWYYFATGIKAFINDDKTKLGEILSDWEKAGLPKGEDYDELLRLYTNWDSSLNGY